MSNLKLAGQALGIQMTATVRELIANFEKAESRVAEAVSAGDEVSAQAVSMLDSRLIFAFDQLIGAELRESNELMDRIRFLTARLKETSEQGSTTDKIGNKILEDVNSLINLENSDPSVVASDGDERAAPAEALFETCYTSKATMRFAEDELASLCTEAQLYNQKHAITGVLSYDQNTGRFMQILEGPRQPVEELMRSIELDTRHRDMTVKFRNNIENRCYGRWSMFLVTSTDFGTEISS